MLFTEGDKPSENSAYRLFFVFACHSHIKADSVKGFFVFFIVKEDISVITIVVVIEIRHINVRSLLSVGIFKRDDFRISVVVRSHSGRNNFFFFFFDLSHFSSQWFGQFENCPAFGTNNRIAVQIVIFSAAICTDAFGSKFWSCHSFASSPSKVFDSKI